MRIVQDARFREERTLHVFRFTCEDCAMFDTPEGRVHARAHDGPQYARRADGDPSASACAHGYPTDEHRAARYDDHGARLVFCKEWESA